MLLAALGVAAGLLAAAVVALYGLILPVALVDVGEVLPNRVLGTGHFDSDGNGFEKTCNLRRQKREVVEKVWKFAKMADTALTVAFGVVSAGPQDHTIIHGRANTISEGVHHTACSPSRRTFLVVEVVSWRQVIHMK